MKRPLLKHARCAGLIFLSATLLVALSACRSARRDEPLVGPLPLDNSKVQQGRLVFASHCHACHPGGAGGLGPSLNDKPLPRFLMKTQVRRGLGAMPAFNKHAIDADELDALMNYMIALRHHDHPVGAEQ
jgi:mono/diheme cytochrome c family protein